MARAKKVLEPRKKYLIDEELLNRVFSEHRIAISSGCEYGDHWECWCGVEGLDDTRSHLIESIIANADAA